MQVECPNVQFDYAGAELPNCATACDNIVVHDCLSYGGQSGSPIWSLSFCIARCNAMAKPFPLP